MTCNSTLSACAAVALWRGSLELYRCLQSHLGVAEIRWFLRRSLQRCWKNGNSHLKLAPPKKTRTLADCTFIKWGTVSPTVAWNEFEDVLDFSLRCYWLKFRAEWYKKAQHAAEAVTGSALLSACQRSRQWMTSLRTWKGTFSFQMSFQKCWNHRGADTTWGWQSCCFPMLVFDPKTNRKATDWFRKATRWKISAYSSPDRLHPLSCSPGAAVAGCWKRWDKGIWSRKMLELRWEVPRGIILMPFFVSSGEKVCTRLNAMSQIH